MRKKRIKRNKPTLLVGRSEISLLVRAKKGTASPGEAKSLNLFFKIIRDGREQSIATVSAVYALFSLNSLFSRLARVFA